MIEGVFDRVDTNGKFGLAVSSGRVSVGPEDDVVSAGWLNETELPGNETPEIELIAKEETVGKLKEIDAGGRLGSLPARHSVYVPISRLLLVSLCMPNLSVALVPNQQNDSSECRLLSLLRF